MRNRSTISNIAEIIQEIAEVLDKRGQMDVVFDKISLQRIIGKLQHFTFSNHLLDLISSYLHDRNQYVSYNGFKSSP
ncbi:unnamed protein product [Acanthoscelides obtectus]|uniref:Uncharacterized protein n=1 Tax=Acanthoscelides obtectus TaxID=200917 RepID=A0A9P0MLW7_ACAOB|nr:unnamed protein product [Acanthoscelides obtectus]CAK1626532.1 hypothetical protein AOBTE_LOCUS3905 [Acanthoscelides obtectus]